MLFLGGTLAASSCEATTPPPPALDVDDVSFLWPLPKTKTDLDNLISLDDSAADGKIFSSDLLNKLMEEAKRVSVGDSKITLPDEAAFKNPKTWKVAGIRVNPSALGSNPAVLQFAGILPGVRLIVQPVTTKGDQIVIHDFAAHIVFNYSLPRPDGKKIPFIPDNNAFQAIVRDLRDIKSSLKDKGIDTTGQELGVHPGFSNKIAGFTDKMRNFLKTHLNRKRLDVVSFMGIPSKFEPWIFFKVTIGQDGSLTREPISGNLNPRPISQKIDFRATKKVDPAPALDSAAIQQGFGISTASLFRDDIQTHLEDDLFPEANLPIPPVHLQLRDVADLIANPNRSHTGNTDCVSCHTETTRRNLVPGLKGQEGVTFKQPPGISKVSAEVLARDTWNLRNFGWGALKDGTFKTTITQRAANEAAESAQIINNSAMGDPSVSQPIAEVQSKKAIRD